MPHKRTIANILTDKTGSSEKKQIIIEGYLDTIVVDWGNATRETVQLKIKLSTSEEITITPKDNEEVSVFRPRIKTHTPSFEETGETERILNYGPAIISVENGGERKVLRSVALYII